MRNEINTIIKEMQGSFYERDTIIEAMWAALLSNQHMLLLGVPGTAKSMLVQSLCSKIKDADYFQWLLTRFSTPEELFGPVSLRGLENDEYRRIMDGKLPESNVAFIDEIFKGGAAILNSLLTIVNERQFDNGKERVDVPLLSMFGASNELPQAEELSALYDRFILRFDVPYIQEGSNWEDLMMNNALEDKNKQTTINIEQLYQAQKEVREVTLTKDVVNIMREIKMKLEYEGLVASDRRWKQTISVLKARAWLAGRESIEKQDLVLLCDMLWQEPDQRTNIVSIVLDITNPLDLAAVKLYDDIKDVFHKWSKEDSANTTETAQKIKMGIGKLDDTIRTGNPDLLDKTRQVRSSMGKWYQEVIEAIDI